MKKPSLPLDEALRLQELISLEILDSEGEAAFDEIVSLASYITGCPISLISLVDRDRQWFKARVGLDATQTHRDISFCGHSIHGDSLFTVVDTHDDDRFRDNPLVMGQPAIRFYAGQPLITSNGYKIGTLCIIDRVPRVLNEEQKKHLASLGRQVIQMMELRVLNREQKMRSITQSQFLSNISHEIRTPMTGILGYASIAKERLTEVMSKSEKNMLAEEADVFKYLENIERQSKYVLSVVSNVLDLSKGDAGGIELDIIQFSVQELIDHLLSLFQLQAERKAICFSVEACPEVPRLLSADFTRLKQIATNLVSNSMKFTEHGSIDVRLSYINKENLLTISVKDSGMGMTETQSARLFVPFAQADASVSSKYGGTGLGLALSRQMARAMGGDVVLVTSRPNEGTTFEAKVRAEVITRVSTAEEDFAPKREATFSTLRQIGNMASILLVDDSADNRFLFNHNLKKLGLVAQQAASGEEALIALSKHRFDVVYLDVEMPGMSGLEVLKRIRDLRHRVKVIAFTAHDSKEHRARFKSEGFDGLLTKPFDLNQLGDSLFENLVYSH